MTCRNLRGGWYKVSEINWELIPEIRRGMCKERF